MVSSHENDPFQQSRAKSYTEEIFLPPNVSRKMDSISENEISPQTKFADECIKQLTLESGQDGLVSTNDFASFVSSLAGDPMEFYNLPTSIQFKFVALLCNGNNLDTCAQESSREEENFGYKKEEFDKIIDLCFDIYVNLKNFGWTASFETTGISTPETTFTPTDHPTILSTTSSPSILSERLTSAPSISSTSNPPTIASIAPSKLSSSSPTASISEIFTILPTPSPSFLPSALSSSKPSLRQSENSTKKPSIITTSLPTIETFNNSNILISSIPSMTAINSPSSKPSHIPLKLGTNLSKTEVPTVIPSSSKSNFPSLVPSSNPTIENFATPSAPPSTAPSELLSIQPTLSTSSNDLILPIDTPSTVMQTPDPTNMPTEILQFPSISPTRSKPLSPTSHPSITSRSNPLSLTPSSPSITFTLAQENEPLANKRGIGITGILVASCFVFGTIVFAMYRKKKRRKFQWLNSSSARKDRSKSYFDFDFVSLKSESDDDQNELIHTSMNLNGSPENIDQFLSEDPNLIPQFNPSSELILNPSPLSRSSNSNELPHASDSFQNRISLKRFSASIRAINATVDNYQNRAISKIVDDKSSENDEMSSLSSHHSSLQSSQLRGEHIKHVPLFFSQSAENALPSPQNMNGDDRKHFLNRLITSGDWEALAAESAMYQSESSSVSSNAQLTVSSSSTDKFSDKKRRPFLDYAVGRHTLASIAASGAMDNQSKDQTLTLKDQQKNSSTLSFFSPLLPSRVYAKNENDENSPVNAPSPIAFFNYFKNREGKSSAFFDDTKNFELSPQSSDLRYVSSVSMSPSKSDISDSDYFDSKPIALSTKFEQAITGNNSNINSTLLKSPTQRSPITQVSTLSNQMLDLEFRYIGGTRVVMNKKEEPINWGVSGSSKSHPLPQEDWMNLALAAPSSSLSHSGSSSFSLVGSESFSKFSTGSPHMSTQKERDDSNSNFQEIKILYEEEPSLQSTSMPGKKMIMSEKQAGAVTRSNTRVLSKQKSMNKKGPLHQLDENVIANKDFDMKRKTLPKKKIKNFSPHQDESKAKVNIRINGNVFSSDKKRRKSRSFLSKSEISSEDSIQDNLDRAIEIGDWDAVGEHAAYMIDGSESDFSDTSDVIDSGESIDERIDVLESLIEADDWKGFGKD